MAFVGALRRFGLINDAVSPLERVFVEEVSDETSGEIRQVPDTEQDPQGRTIFTAYRSELTLSALDIGGIPQVSAWMDARSKVKAVLEVPQAAVMWTTPTRITVGGGYSPTEVALQKAEYSMTLEQGDKEGHGVVLTRNALAPYSDQGTISQGVVWPIDGSELTLSASFGGGGGTVSLEAQDAGGTALDSSSTTSSSSGRASAVLTTPTDTHIVQVDVSGDTPTDAALRLDGKTTYVPK
jgi:hypothetical protein